MGHGNFGLSFRVSQSGRTSERDSVRTLSFFGFGCFIMSIHCRVKAEFDGISRLQFPENFRFFLRVVCAHCQTERDAPIPVSVLDEVPISNTPGNTTTVALKCKFCKRESTLRLEQFRPVYHADDPGFYPLLSFEGRGLNILSWEVDARTPPQGYPVGEDSPTVFTVDLSEGDWSDVDPLTNLPVSVLNFSTDVDRGEPPRRRK